MKRILWAAIALALTLPTYAQTKAEEKHFKAVVSKAAALPLDKCEINDGKKGWLYPNGDPIGNLPLYRCIANTMTVSATFTQSPYGADPREIVEYCKFSEVSKICETVPGDRPAHRNADLAKFGIRERKMDEVEREYVSIGTIPLRKCEPPREKPQLVAKKN
jgi:hypothetical protein